jgi:hypothetical protein
MKNMSYVFWWVPSLIKLQPEKNGTVVWPSVGMFGGCMSLDCFSGFLDQITTRKKVQSSGHWLQCWIVLAGLLLCFSVGSLIKLQITTGKKGTVIWPLRRNIFLVNTSILYLFDVLPNSIAPK